MPHVAAGCGAGSRQRVPAGHYSAAGLRRVRHWEQSWSEKKIDHETVEGVKEFLPESLNGIALGQYTAMQSFDLRSQHATMLSSGMTSGLTYDRAVFTTKYLQKKGY